MARNQLRKRIEEQVKKSVLLYAIYRPESAITLGMTIIFTALSALDISWFPIQWWIWPLFGLAAEALIVFSTLQDEQFYRHVFDQMFHQEFDITTLRDQGLRDKLAKALEYRELVVKEIEHKADAVLDDYLMNMARGLEDWLEELYHLAERLDIYWHDPIIARDIKSVPAELERLQRSLRRENNPAVKAELEKTLATKQGQWEILSNLRETMARAELQLENTVSAMGTVYMQVVLLGAKDVDSNRAQRLQADMVEQVHSLEDLSLAMDEVYQAG